MSRVRGVTAASSASSSASATTTRAPLAWSGPSRPKCSWSVVTTSSSAPRPSPATTIWQPRVVESVSATSSGGGAEDGGEAGADALPLLEDLLDVRRAAAALGQVALEPRPGCLDRGSRQRPDRAGVEVRVALEHRELRACLVERHSTTASTGA